MGQAEQYLPLQITGRQTDFVHEANYGQLNEAQIAFQQAAARLLTINEWHIYTGPGSAKFTLTNNLGDEFFGLAAEGLNVSIDLPAPGSDAGDGLDWVIIENVETGGSSETEEEFVLMTVRPVPDPRKSDAEIGHFFKDVSTSTFVVQRKGNVVSAEAHGRNETPNNEGVDLHDKIRNTAIALMARVGLSGPQWKNLIKGLIEYKSKPDE